MNYRYDITITEGGETYTGDYYFLDHFEAADFLDENDRNGATCVINSVEEIPHAEFLRHV